MADQRRPPLPETRRRQHARLDTSRESNPDLYEEHLKTYKLEDDPRTYGPSTQLYMRFRPVRAGLCRSVAAATLVTTSASRDGTSSIGRLV